MKTCSTALFFILFSAFINGEKETNKVFQQLYALEGKWIMKTKKGAIGEAWKKINNGYLQNRGYMIRSDDTIVTERVALRDTKNEFFIPQLLKIKIISNQWHSGSLRLIITLLFLKIPGMIFLKESLTI